MVSYNSSQSLSPLALHRNAVAKITTGCLSPTSDRVSSLWHNRLYISVYLTAYIDDDCPMFCCEVLASLPYPNA